MHPSIQVRPNPSGLIASGYLEEMDG